MILKIRISCLVFLCFTLVIYSQDRRKASLKDTLDNKLDVSHLLAEANGFIPVPSIVTEPALGGIGLFLAPVFITPNKHAKLSKNYVAPNITAGFVGYTANKTWGIGGIRSASLPQFRLKYRFGVAYANVNLDFYRNLPIAGETKFTFNFRSLPILASVTREVAKDSRFYAGIEYLFLRSTIKPEFPLENIPEFLDNLEFTSNLSFIGIVLDYDTRDNVFTPNKGTLIETKFSFNDDWTGSDYTFQNLNLSINQFFQFSSNWVSGFRLESKFQLGDAPFYVNPAIQLRGVPLARYQGSSTYLVESEQRYDFSLRWSAILFGGLAKATTERVSFSDATLVYNYGTGFRYLLARLFKLRVGMDIAKSNDDWGYYITFGSAW